ncbi:putative Cilia- and flagella-associated protein 52 [Blattamonas nauphoetae]|uniref:Cilia- and flagella-associated protein 52 n=1 Tax=Blattamonas nauphoetae TaxID=2049346 RepID=A0ABQ9XKR1_9EUKA|nr:putative Cilia- and flagella-associated protein 52 [Blattamonas nauphoetae]
MATLELEHCIGGIYTVPNTLHLHPNGKDYVSIAGSSVIISDMTDPHNQSLLKGHTGTVNSVALSPGGQFIASAQLGDDADVFIWDFDSQNIIHKLCQHEHGIACMAFSHDNRLLTTIGDHFDRQLYVWDMKSGYIVCNKQLSATGAGTVHQQGTDRRPPPQPSRSSASAISVRATPSASPSDGDVVDVVWGGHARDIKRRETADLIFATAGPNVSLWTLTPQTGELVQEKFQPGTYVRSYSTVGFTAQGEKCIGGTTSGDFVVFLVRTMVVETVIPSCSHGITSMSITPQNQIIIGGGDGSLSLFRQNGKQIVGIKQTFLTEEKHPVTAITCGGGEKRCLCATADGTVHAVTLDEQCQETPLSYSHSGPVSCISFPPGVSDKFASCSVDDETIRVFDLSTYDVFSTSHLLKSPPTCVAWAGECLAAGYTGGEIRFVDAIESRVLWQLLDAHREGVTTIDVDRNVSMIVSGGGAGDLRVWDIRTQKLKCQLKNHSQKVCGLRIMEDNKHCVSASKDKSLCVSDLLAERRLSIFKYRAALLDVAPLPDLRQVVTPSQDRSIVFWDLSVADPTRIIQDAHEDAITTISMAHDMDMFATGSLDSVVKLWKTNGQLLGEFFGHSSAINCIRFSPDDKQLLSCGDDGNILVWNIF